MSVVDDIKSRLDILEVVANHTALQRSGKAFKANCPFHQERTPSFFVFPDRQSWRCFGACATGGDIFSFVMKTQNLEFAEALKRLAMQAGVTLPSRERRTEQQSAFDINEAAKEYFRFRLASSQGSEARAYLDRRGLDKLTIEKFELGLSPKDGESLKNHLMNQGFSAEQLAQAGVVSGGDSGRYRDLFRGRLIFPIRNGQGDLGGFGGRALDDSNPKYLNSPRTPVFDKGRILYGLYLAKDAIRQQGVVIVEGYMDAIMAHQHGYSNVVASMGTALTENQVTEIRRLTGQITMALDADAAGQQATLRSLESSWKVFQTHTAAKVQGTTLFQRQDATNLKVAVLPDDLDPDEVIRQSPEDWANLVESGRPLFEYLLPALSAQVDISSPPGKAWVSQRLFNFIAAVPEPIQQDHYFQMLANHLKVSEDTLRASMSRITPSPRNIRSRVVRGTANPSNRAADTTSSAFAKLANDPIEDHCLARLLQNPELYETLEELRPEYFRRPENREIVKHVLYVASDGFDESAIAWLQQTVEEELAPHLEYLFGKVLPPLEQRGGPLEVNETIHRLEERYLRDLKVEEAMRFSDTGADGLMEESDDQVLEVNHRIKRNEVARNGLTQNV
ncbi:MAG TPA: DNA primase [Dehalococcoidia bacterium]|nr:DNA primase [Dehalococcoidia bacterium]